MPQIRPITDLRNTNDISDACHAVKEPIFITQNGYGDLVVMSIETYEQIVETGTVEKMADALADAILSLDEMPYRGSIRRTGAFANRGYRQIFAKNFTIVHRIDEAKKRVVIVTVRYTPSSF